MIEMTSRERILRVFAHKEADRIPMVDSAWAGTVKRWREEGLPEKVDWQDYFGFDKVIRINPNNSPKFETKIIEKNDKYTIRTTAWGQTQKVFNELDSTPEVLESYYNTRERWEEAKARMLDGDINRVNWELLKNHHAKWTENGVFRQLTVWFGFDVAHSHMIGTEEMLIAMYDDPDWVVDVFDTYLKVSLDLCQRILDEGYEFDGIFWYDDMGYKNTTFFSPAIYRELLKPFHKKAVDWAHERGLVAELHSCGFVESLVPDIVDIGVDMLNPMERKAGMDPIKLKNQFGDRLAFHGGINAQMWDDLDKVTAEMEMIIPAMKQNGGYIFASDHSIPNSVSFENMKAISELAHKLGKY